MTRALYTTYPQLLPCIGQGRDAAGEGEAGDASGHTEDRHRSHARSAQGAAQAGRAWI